MDITCHSGIASGDAVFVPSIGTDWVAADRPCVSYKFGTLVRATDTSLSVELERRLARTADYSMLDSGTAGKFRLTRFTTTSAIVLNSRNITLGAGSYDLLYFGGSSVHLAYIANANGDLAHTEMFSLSASTNPTISGVTVNASYSANCREYRAVPDLMAAATTYDLNRIDRDGIRWHAVGAALYRDGVLVNTFPTAVMQLHDTTAGTVLACTAKKMYRSASPFSTWTEVITLGSEGEWQQWQSAITERADDGKLWCAHYCEDQSFPANRGLVRESTDDGATWSAIFNSEDMFGPDMSHNENIFYDPATDTVNLVVGESWDTTEVLAWCYADDTDSWFFYGDPTSWTTMGGYYRSVGTNEGLLFGSDSDANSTYFSYASWSSGWTLNKGVQMFGRYGGFSQCYTSASGVGLYTVQSNRSIFAMVNRMPLLLWDGNSAANEWAPDGTADFRGNTLIYPSAEYTFALDSADYPEQSIYHLDVNFEYVAPPYLLDVNFQLRQTRRRQRIALGGV